MPKRGCLAAIAAEWEDIAPVGVRAAEQAPERRDASRLGAEAVVSAGTQLTYGQLDRSANQLAPDLAGMGVGPETLAGVCVERGTEAIRCLLAILKAGGAYLAPRAAIRAARGARLLNAYGLTETTITATLFDVGEDSGPSKPSASVPVGQPIRHAQVLVLDRNLNQVPAGGQGEIYIGGCGVARGYLGRPELTAEPFSAERAQRHARQQDVSHRRPRALA